MNNEPSSDTAITSALLDLVRACSAQETSWSLIGGQALRYYGVPRHTDDTDALVEPDDIESVANALVDTFQWVPQLYNDRKRDYAPTNEVTVHLMQDPVLFDVGEERRMIPLRTPLGLVVELLAAQHPIEQDMIVDSVVRSHYGVRIPVAPLGGVLLVKTKADRAKDVAAIEQTAEHLPGDTLDSAVKWARRHDKATTEDLKQLLNVAKDRLRPRATRKSPRHK